jgi:hypothetical protein
MWKAKPKFSSSTAGASLRETCAKKARPWLLTWVLCKHWGQCLLYSHPSFGALVWTKNIKVLTTWASG